VSSRYLLSFSFSFVFVFVLVVDPSPPFLTLPSRAFEDERQARMGVTECSKHELVHAYPVMFEKPEAEVAHLKCTLLIMPSGTLKITGEALPMDFIHTDKTMPADLAVRGGEGWWIGQEREGETLPCVTA
jgi:hypothetical protein